MSIKNEKLAYNDNEIIFENEGEQNVISKDTNVYPMSGIKVGRGFYSVFELKRKHEKEPKKIILDSDFQRGNKVWNLKQKSELIESVIMGLPLPVFYFNEDKKGRLIVVDGRQRLTTLFEYIDNKFPLRKLKIMSKYSYKKFKNLDPVIQSTIEDYQIQSHNIPTEASDKIKLDIFDRVNRGGTKLTDQEIRNALHQGEATTLLKQICESTAFSEATENAFENEKRMKDKYLVLRFLALYLYYNNKILDDEKNVYQYKNDMVDLLSKTMEYLNACDKAEIEKLEKLTISALENTYFYIPKSAFRLILKDKDNKEKKYPVNMNIFETVLYAMAQFPFKDESQRTYVKNAVEQMKISNEFRDSINNHRDSESKIDARYKMAKKLIEGVNKND